MKHNDIWKKCETILFLSVFGVIFSFVFLTMDYQDGIINAGFGYSICRSIFSGDFTSIFNSNSWSYGFTLYFIYAFWSIPLVIIDLISGNVRSIATDRSTILWYKCMLLLFFVICCYYFYKIVMQLIADKKNSRLMTMVLATSSLMCLLPFAITQCDVVTLVFVMAGIYYLLKNEDKGFLLFFAIAVTMKYMALFIFIPLFLFRYKHMRQMVRNILIVGILLVVTIVFLSFSGAAKAAFLNPSYYDVTSMASSLYDGAALSLGIGNMSLVSAYFVAICVFAYLWKPQSETVWQKGVLWLCLAGWYTLFLFFGAHVYWYVLIAPFIILIALNRAEYLKFGLATGVVLANVMLLERVYSESWVFGGGAMFDNLLLRGISQGHSPILYKLFNEISLGYFAKLSTVYVSVIVVLAFTLLIVFFPGNKEEQSVEIQSKSLKGIIWVQTILLALWVGCMIWGEVRLTKGIEYDIAACSFSEGVVCENGEAVLANAQTAQYKTGSVYVGKYQVTIQGEGISEEDIYVGYYYGEDISIPLSVVEESEDSITVAFETDQFLDYVNICVTNQDSQDIIFRSFLLRETK